MKLLLFFVMINKALAIPSTKDACTGCDENVAKLGKYLLSDKQVTASENAIKEVVCGTMEPSDKQACIDAIDKHGQKVAELLYANPQLTKDLCGAICMAQIDYNIYSDSLNCDDCKNLIMMIGEEMGKSEAWEDVIQLLDGDSFCMDKSSFPSEAEQVNCQLVIEMYTPQILKLGGNLWVKDEKFREETCKAAFTVC